MSTFEINIDGLRQAARNLKDLHSRARWSQLSLESFDAGDDAVALALGEFVEQWSGGLIMLTSDLNNASRYLHAAADRYEESERKIASQLDNG